MFLISKFSKAFFSMVRKLEKSANCIDDISVLEKDSSRILITVYCADSWKIELGKIILSSCSRFSVL